jgi:hypothetical protein
MNFHQCIDAAAWLGCRAATFAVLDFGEDAALIALMFC